MTTALYLLSGPSVPDEVREAAGDRAKAGERIIKAKRLNAVSGFVQNTVR